MNRTAKINGIRLSANDFWYPFIHLAGMRLWGLGFVRSRFVETKRGHGINEKVLSKRSDINKTPRSVVTENTAPFNRSAASHQRFIRQAPGRCNRPGWLVVGASKSRRKGGQDKVMGKRGRPGSARQCTVLPLIGW